MSLFCYVDLILSVSESRMFIDGQEVVEWTLMFRYRCPTNQMLICTSNHGQIYETPNYWRNVYFLNFNIIDM